jgi:hypothetical protein
MGLSLDQIRPAITAAAMKLGRADVGAGGGGRVVADAEAVDRFLSWWRDLYAKAEGCAYTVTDEDRDHAAELVGPIEQTAREHAARSGVVDALGLVQRIAERWMRRYLRDEGVNAYLGKARHPLRYLKRGVATYGCRRGRRWKGRGPPRRPFLRRPRCRHRRRRSAGRRSCGCSQGPGRRR